MKLMRSIRTIFLLLFFLQSNSLFGQYTASRSAQDSLQFELQNYVSGMDRVLKLNPAKPEQKSLVKFLYTGIFSSKLMPKFTVYFDKGPYQSLKTSKSSRGIEGSFSIADSVTSFIIKPSNNLRDSNETLIYLVYKDKKPLPGALASAASFYKIGNFQPNIARLLYRREFQLHPELRAQSLINYFESAVLNPDSLITKEINAAWRDSLHQANDDGFLTRLYNLTLRLQWLTNRPQWKSQLLAKYPIGDLGFEDAISGLTVSEENESLLADMENKFTSRHAQQRLEYIYGQYFKYEVDHGRFEKAEQYSSKIKSKILLKAAYKNAALTLLSKQTYLDTALSFIRKALDLSSFQLQPFSDQPYSKNDEGLKYVKSSDLDLYARILYANSNLQKAIPILEEARYTESSGIGVNERYIKYLLEAQAYMKAFVVADSCIKADVLSDSIKAAHRVAYLKIKPGGTAYETYYQKIIDSVDRAFAVPDYSKLNLKSLDFSLSNLEGKNFTLSEHKGKKVVLYFFSARYNQGINLIWNNEFNKIYNELKGRSDVLLIGIDKTPAYDDNESARMQSRIQVVADFISNGGYSFPILVDKYHHDPKNSGNCYFAVADAYSSDSTGQFYVIDADGMVKYKSYPISNTTTAERFARELRAAIDSRLSNK